MKKITIAIDGFSSTGKSTVARQLAAYLGYVYVDSGAMYRAVTLYAIQNGLIGSDFFHNEKLVSQLGDVHLKFQFNPETKEAEIHLNGKNVEKEIRSMEVSGFVSQIAQVPEVRRKLVEIQQEMGKSKGVVMDGRDIGTVVFPFAELKIFMTADAKERAMRRFLEFTDQGKEVSFESIYENVTQRDHIDTTRDDSPLVKADDAIEIDNTFTNIEDQFHILLQLAKDRIAGRV
jgi:cytidylate kinase